MFYLTLKNCDLHVNVVHQYNNYYYYHYENGVLHINPTICRCKNKEVRLALLLSSTTSWKPVYVSWKIFSGQLNNL